MSEVVCMFCGKIEKYPTESDEMVCGKCVVFLGGSTGEDLKSAYYKAQDQNMESKMKAIAIFMSSKPEEVKAKRQGKERGRPKRLI
jgi:hypothetical protein